MGGTVGLLLATLVAGWRTIRARRTGERISSLQFLSLALPSQGLAAFALVVRMIAPVHLQGLRPAAAIAAMMLAAGWTALWAAARLKRRGTAERDLALGLACVLFLAVCSGRLAWSLGADPATADRGLSPGAPPGTAAAPSILLITLDTVRADHVSAYGYPKKTTPRLDELTRRATLFERAYATSPYTLSSHASLLTGRLPGDHGAHHIPFSAVKDKRDPSTRLPRAAHDFPLGTKGPNLTQELQQRGYRTGAIVSNYVYLANWTGLDRGFQYYHSRPSRQYRFLPVVVTIVMRWEKELSVYLPSDTRWPLHRGPKEQLWMRADTITNAAIEWIRESRDRGFFLFLNYTDAHAPYIPPPPYDSAFADAPGRAATWFTADLQQRISLYDGGLAFADAHVGRLLDWLAAEGRLDGMLVIVTSDHGELFGEHGHFKHDNALYEGVLRIPLVVKLPGQREGTRLAGRVGLHHVPGMVRRVLDGARSPEQMVAGRDGGGDGLLAEFWVPFDKHQSDPLRHSSPFLRAVYQGRLKLIQKEGASDEMYDLEADPKEARDLFVADPAAAAAQRAAMVAALPPLSASLVDRVLPQVDPVVWERLRALGYVK